MLLQYHKKIIDICRNDLLISKISLLSKDEFDELYKQKMILSLVEMNKDNLDNIIYKQLIYKKSRLFRFFRHFCDEINGFGIDYIILKGFAYDILIYDNIYTRTFSDIDLLINYYDFDIFIKKISQSDMKILSITKKHDYYIHEVKLYLQYENERFLVEIKTRHRDLSYEKTQFLLTKSMKIMYNEVCFFTFDYELSLISMILYIYNYFERIASILYLSKIRLCYFFDLKNFINKYLTRINIKKLVALASKLEVSNKIVLVLGYLNEIFLMTSIDTLIDEIINEMSQQSICYESPARINWNFSILDRIFCEKEIKEIIKNYYEEQFYISEYTSKNNIVKYDENYKCFRKYNVSYIINKTCNGLNFEFDNIDKIPFKNYLIYFVFFYKDVYGGFKHPFNVISIRKDSSDIYVFNDKTIEKKDFTFHKEKEKNKYDKYSYNGKKIILEINFDEMKIRNLKNDKFGFYIELMLLDKNYIYIIDRSVDDDTYPQSIIIRGGDYEK